MQRKLFWISGTVLGLLLVFGVGLTVYLYNLGFIQVVSVVSPVTESFDAAVWRRERDHSSEDTARLRMSDDLMHSYLRPGMTAKDVLALIGPAERIVSAKDGSDGPVSIWSYPLAKSKDSPAKFTTLFLSFNREGRLVRDWIALG